MGNAVQHGILKFMCQEQAGCVLIVWGSATCQMQESCLDSHRCLMHAAQACPGCASHTMPSELSVLLHQVFVNARQVHQYWTCAFQRSLLLSCKQTHPSHQWNSELVFHPCLCSPLGPLKP